MSSLDNPLGEMGFNRRVYEPFLRLKESSPVEHTLTLHMHFTFKDPNHMESVIQNFNSNRPTESGRRSRHFFCLGSGGCWGSPQVGVDSEYLCDYQGERHSLHQLSLYSAMRKRRIGRWILKDPVPRLFPLTIFIIPWNLFCTHTVIFSKICSPSCVLWKTSVFCRLVSTVFYEKTSFFWMILGSCPMMNEWEVLLCSSLMVGFLRFDWCKKVATVRASIDFS